MDFVVIKTDQNAPEELKLMRRVSYRIKKEMWTREKELALHEIVKNILFSRDTPDCKFSSSGIAVACRMAIPFGEVLRHANEIYCYEKSLLADATSAQQITSSPDGATHELLSPEGSDQSGNKCTSVLKRRCQL
jgi:hypothetical protein